MGTNDFHDYNLGDIFCIAALIEKNGNEFYRILADCTSNQTKKKIFLYLAEQELKHEALFKTFHKKFCEQIKDFSRHVFSELENLSRVAHNNMLATTNPAELIKKLKDPKDIIAFAISWEEDTIKMFQALQALCLQQYEEPFSELIEEEKGHVAQLKELELL